MTISPCVFGGGTAAEKLGGSGGTSTWLKRIGLVDLNGRGQLKVSLVMANLPDTLQKMTNS